MIDIAKLIEAHRHDLRELGEYNAYKLLAERIEALRNETLYEAAKVCDQRAEARAELPQGKDWMSAAYVTVGNEIRRMARPTKRPCIGSRLNQRTCELGTYGCEVVHNP